MDIVRLRGGGGEATDQESETIHSENDGQELGAEGLRRPPGARRDKETGSALRKTQAPAFLRLLSFSCQISWAGAGETGGESAYCPRVRTSVHILSILVKSRCASVTPALRGRDG